jgi:hypothetical protein
MAETTNSVPSGSDESGEPANAAPAPVTKVSRARATTSDVPRKVSSTRPAAAADKPGSATAKPTPAVAVAPVSTTDVAARPANVQIHQGGADSVSGDTVQITQGGASVVTATNVEIRQGGVGNAHADDIHVSLGGVGLARADRVSVEMGAIGLALAREARVTQGMARTIVAQDVRVDQGLVGTALVGRATFERPSAVFLLLAGRTEGPIRALLDWRGALAFGAAFGLLVGLIRRR